MKLKLDENFDIRLVGMLTAESHDVDTVLAEGLSGCKDETIYDALACRPASECTNRSIGTVNSLQNYTTLVNSPTVLLVRSVFTGIKYLDRPNHTSPKCKRGQLKGEGDKESKRGQLKGEGDKESKRG